MCQGLIVYTFLGVLPHYGAHEQLSKARKLIAYFAISELGIESFEVEQILDVTQSGVSKLRFKGHQLSVVEVITLAGLEAMLLSH